LSILDINIKKYTKVEKKSHPKTWFENKESSCSNIISVVKLLKTIWVLRFFYMKI